MLDLLKGYTLSQIIVFIIMLLLAIKSIWDLIDYFVSKYNRKFKKDYGAIKEKEELDSRLNKLLENQEKLMARCDNFDNKLEEAQNLIESITERVDTLTESDMHDIKQAIVKDYHYFTEKQGWIDDFSLEVIESRYKDYEAENGNSFVHTLVEELRALPKHPLI